LPAEGAALVKTVLESLATVKTPGDGRVIDQRRADALVDVFARVIGDPTCLNTTASARRFRSRRGLDVGGMRRTTGRP